jgi:hypothetical protein
MKAVRFALSGLLLAGLLPGWANAEGARAPVTVIELFTSQSCYSCPPAEAYLGELAHRDDIVALEFHVDYWDRLNYGVHGRWKDVFSTPEMTERQRRYNREIRGTGSVYTPQMVVDGRAEAVGSRQGEMGDRIAEVRTDGRPRVAVEIARVQGGGIEVSVNGAAGGGDIWLVTFIREHTTKVLRGENHGKSLTNHNVVRDVRHAGTLDGGGGSVAVSDLALEPGQGCAVLVQDGDAGPVLGAAYCPAGLDDTAS